MSALLETEVGFNPRKIVCGLHKVFPEVDIPKLGRIDSLYGERLREGMGWNALYYYTKKGELKPTKHEQQRLAHESLKGLSVNPTLEEGWYKETNHYDELPENVAGIAGIALAPWGEKGVFLQHFGEPGEQAPSYVDIPDHLQAMNMMLLSGVVSEMMDDDEPVYVGLNNSAGGLEEKDKGLMSILRPHLQVVKFGKKYVEQTPQDIISARNEEGDDEIRKVMGEDIAIQLGEIRRGMGEEIVTQLAVRDLPNFWGVAEATADNMGASIIFPGFKPQDLMRPEFRDFLKVVFHTTHHQVELLHEERFTSKLSDVIEYVQSHRDTLNIDEEAVKAGFDRKFIMKEDENESPRATTMKKLEVARRLRHPVGWALMMQFTPEGMFMVITPSITNEAMGPVESLKYGLDRQTKNTKKEEMVDILESGRRVLRNAIKIREELPIAA